MGADLGLIGKKQQVAGENYIIRSLIIYTIYRILFG
jgi:hypothetical protein